MKEKGKTKNKTYARNTHKDNVLGIKEDGSE